MKLTKIILLIIAIFYMSTAGAEDNTIEDNDLLDKWNFLYEAEDELICLQDAKYTLSFHTGITTPYGDLKKIVDDGRTVNFDIVFPLSSNLSWDLRLGWSDFPGTTGNDDFEIWNLSANIAYALRFKKPWLFVNGGLGLYKANYGNTNLGFNIGAGLGYPLRSNIVLEMTYNYHMAFTGSPDPMFGKIQTGILIRF